MKRGPKPRPAIERVLARTERRGECLIFTVTAPLDLDAIELTYKAWAEAAENYHTVADLDGSLLRAERAARNTLNRTMREVVPALVERCRAAEAERDARRDRKVLNLQLEARVVALESGLQALLDTSSAHFRGSPEAAEARNAARALLKGTE